ncbi:enoyl-CoA hydratase-related protein [Rhodopseudomonas palustris]|uniref:enoyl-CoA hydratase/isomerase family protein n=1 Tax=Rhodopseudomonas palustris TaxID=1076 RepID=UPI0020CF3A70|nr:enoyl-CoA hydratase-related protein [Rhodopseudomonas palustris]MCP9628880.1 enoyl-CoA hydratase-related protein [Rhodopseudomonas palustris]
MSADIAGDDAVIFERRDDVMIVRLNSPASRNALQPAVKHQLETRIPELLADASVRCLVITGTGPSFCAGGDISNMADRGAPQVRRRMQVTHNWAQRLLAAEKPVIAAVNGSAAGAGFSLALLCDIVLMSDQAYFRAAFPGLGAAPDLGLALTLPRAIGAMRAKDILLTNRRVDAAEAQALGIATRVVPADQLLDAAVALAAELAAGPATSLGLTKMLVNGAFAPIEQFFALEAFAQGVAFGSDEFAEGVAAFLGKRKPDFKAKH